MINIFKKLFRKKQMPSMSENVDKLTNSSTFHKSYEIKKQFSESSDRAGTRSAGTNLPQESSSTIFNFHNLNLKQEPFIDKIDNTPANKIVNQFDLDEYLTKDKE